MNTLTSSLFGTVDRMSRRVAPLNKAIDGMLARLLPQATAKGCSVPSGWINCGKTCTNTACAMRVYRGIQRYAPESRYCNQSLSCSGCICVYW